MDLDLGQFSLDLGELLVGEVDVGGAEVLLDALQFAGARDGHDEFLLVQHPGQRDLRRGRALLLGEVGQ